jgi:hypothetical protein
VRALAHRDRTKRGIVITRLAASVITDSAAS